MSNAFLRPAIRPLNALRVPTKFGIITLVFFLAALLPTLWMVKTQTAALAVTGMEVKGMEYFGPLFILVKHGVFHRLALSEASKAGAEEDEDARRSLDISIDEDLKHLAEVDGKNRQALALGEMPGNLIAKATALLNEATPGQEIQAHQQLLWDIHQLNARIFDASLLMADPDIPTFYLTDLTTVRLPNQIDQMLSLALLSRKAPTGKGDPERTQIEQLIGSAQSTLDAIGIDLSDTKGFANRESFLRLSVPLKRHQATISQALGLMGSRGAQESQDPTPASLQFACKEALDSCFIFQETALRVLNDRFALRIQAAQRELRWTLGGSLGATLLAFYLLAGLYDSLKDGLKAMESSLAALAKGDLGRPAQVESKDEIGQLATHLNLTLASLGQMVSHIQESAQAIEKTSGDIAQSSEDLAQRTQTQAATLEETTTSLQQLSAMAVRTGQSAQNAGGDAQRMDQLVAGCGSAVHQMADIIRNIDGASSRVVDITSVVDAIAFKANLLAVNAVVRAAAGQPEEGFSMLASEVHGLGKRSADASREIKTLTQESLALIQAGSTQALQTDEAVKRITQELRQIVDFISQISAAAGEQSLGITQISQAMDELERTTLSNAGLVHQTNAAASDLAGQAMLLTSLTARFKAPA